MAPHDQQFTLVGLLWLTTKMPLSSCAGFLWSVKAIVFRRVILSDERSEESKDPYRLQQTLCRP